MKRTFFAVAVLCLFFVSVARAAEFTDTKFVFPRNDTQQHFWLSAGGAFLGTQTLRLMNIPRRPATWMAAGGVLGAGLAKEFLLDFQPSVNDLMADSLGVALGTLACVTIRFDGYFDDGPLPETNRESPEPKGEIIPMKVLD